MARSLRGEKQIDDERRNQKQDAQGAETQPARHWVLPCRVKRKPDRRMKISLLENVVMRGSVGEPSSSYDVNECEKANGPSETREMPLLLAVAPCCQE